MKWIRRIGSIYFAIFLIASLGILLIISTTFEAIYGIPFAQKVFYQAGWFDLFLSLLWFNIFFATLSRWPFKRKHTGFIITHTGILLLLIGSLIARLFGVEGQSTLLEGERWNQMQQDGYELAITIDDSPQYVFDFELTNKKRILQIPNHNTQFLFHELSEGVLEDITINNKGGIPNQAIGFKIQSAIAGIEQNFWLMEHSQNNPFSDHLSLGPAEFWLLNSTNGNDLPNLILYKEDDKKPLAQISISENELKDIKLEESGYIIENLRYFPNAKVEDNKIINSSDEIFNPAVEFIVKNEKGVTEKHTKFAFFPNFESLHGRESKNVFSLNAILKTPYPENFIQSKPPYLLFKKVDSTWKYESKNTKGDLKEGIVEINKPFSTGWMDMEVTVTHLYDHADSTVTTKTNQDRGKIGLNLSLMDESQNQWVYISKPATFSTEEGNAQVELQPKLYRLPFSLKLIDFRKIDYPGTNSPSSFESDVILFDPEENVKIEKTIKMNEPLDYKGYRIFQSSYIQDPEFGEASVFTIAKNPGIWLIYLGGIIILMGVITLFYIKPFSIAENIHGSK